MVECLVPFTGHCDLWPSILKNHVQSISLLLLKVGIPNLMGGNLDGGVSHTIFWSL